MTWSWMAIFVCMCNVPGICYDECSLQNLWASFVMSWTAGNSLWSNFNVAFLHSLLFLSTSMRMWTQSMDFKHRINSSTQVFCNTSATGVKMRLRVRVLT